MLVMVTTCHTEKCNAGTVTKCICVGCTGVGLAASPEGRLGDELEANDTGPGNGWNDHSLDSQRDMKADHARTCNGLAKVRHRTSCGHGMNMHGMTVLHGVTACRVRKAPVALQALSQAN